MTKTFPAFYKIAVAANLIASIANGGFPSEETVVYSHARKEPVPGKGIMNLENRHYLFSCSEVFKKDFKDHVVFITNQKSTLLKPAKEDRRESYLTKGIEKTGKKIRRLSENESLRVQ